MFLRLFEMNIMSLRWPSSDIIYSVFHPVDSLVTCTYFLTDLYPWRVQEPFLVWLISGRVIVHESKKKKEKTASQIEKYLGFSQAILYIKRKIPYRKTTSLLNVQCLLLVTYLSKFSWSEASPCLVNLFHHLSWTYQQSKTLPHWPSQAIFRKKMFLSMYCVWLYFGINCGNISTFCYFQSESVI